MPDYIFKFIVIGPSGVGKSTITYTFLNGNFTQNLKSTIGVVFEQKSIQLDGLTITLQIYDTQGQDKY